MVVCTGVFPLGVRNIDDQSTVRKVPALAGTSLVPTPSERLGPSNLKHPRRSSNYAESSERFLANSLILCVFFLVDIGEHLLAEIF